MTARGSGSSALRGGGTISEGCDDGGRSDRGCASCKLGW